MKDTAESYKKDERSNYNRRIDVIDFEKAVKDCNPPTQVEIDTARSENSVVESSMFRGFIIVNLIALAAIALAMAASSPLADVIEGFAGALIASIISILIVAHLLRKMLRVEDLRVVKVMGSCVGDNKLCPEYIEKVNKQGRGLVQGELDALEAYKSKTEYKASDQEIK